MVPVSVVDRCTNVKPPLRLFPTIVVSHAVMSLLIVPNSINGSNRWREIGFAGDTSSHTAGDNVGKLQKPDMPRLRGDDSQWKAVKSAERSARPPQF